MHIDVGRKINMQKYKIEIGLVAQDEFGQSVVADAHYTGVLRMCSGDFGACGEGKGLVPRQGTFLQNPYRIGVTEG